MLDDNLLSRRRILVCWLVASGGYHKSWNFGRPMDTLEIFPHIMPFFPSFMGNPWDVFVAMTGPWLWATCQVFRCFWRPRRSSTGLRWCREGEVRCEKVIHSGELLHSNGKWPIYSGFSHEKMVIFNSCVKLPEGKRCVKQLEAVGNMWNRWCWCWRRWR